MLMTVSWSTCPTMSRTTATPPRVASGSAGTSPRDAPRPSRRNSSRGKESGPRIGGITRSPITSRLNTFFIRCRVGIFQYSFGPFQVLIPSCSSDEFSGTRGSSPGTGNIVFHGRHIFSSVLRDLTAKFGLDRASSVILVGSGQSVAGLDIVSGIYSPTVKLSEQLFK